MLTLLTGQVFFASDDRTGAVFTMLSGLVLVMLAVNVILAVIIVWLGMYMHQCDELYVEWRPPEDVAGDFESIKCESQVNHTSEVCFVMVLIHENRQFRLTLLLRCLSQAQDQEMAVLL